MTSKTTIVKMLGKIAFVDVPASIIAKAGRRISPGSGKVIMLDLDETLLKTNSSFELLAQVVGENKAMERYQYYRSLVKNGKMSLQDAQLAAHQEMVELGTTMKDYHNMVDRVIREGKVREDVLQVAKYLQSIGRKVVLVTKSAQTIADLFSQQFRLSGAIGTDELFQNGKLAGIKRLIGDKKNRKVRVETKMQRIEEWCRKSGVPFSPRNISIVTDSYDDYLTLRKVGIGLLFVPHKAETHQKIAKKFGLSDFQIEEVDPDRVRKMKLSLRFPKAAIRVPSRVNRTRPTRHTLK